MKKIVILFCVWLMGVSVFAQTVSVCTEKTASLIFSYPIRHVDIGNAAVLVQRVKDADNLLLVKAAVANFKATNLSVVTSDGQLYSIDVVFDNAPAETVYCVAEKEGLQRISFPGESMNLADLQSYSTGILDNSRQTRGIRNKKWDMEVNVHGIYIRDNVLFFHLLMSNLSAIGFDVDFIRFYIVDRKKSKRTAVQEVEVKPLFQAGKTVSVPAFSKGSAVFAFSKFTIPDDKHFIIQLGEKNGGRHLRLRMNNRKIVRAKILPTLN